MRSAPHLRDCCRHIEAARAASSKLVTAADLNSSDARFNAQLDEMRGALHGTLESGKTLATRRVRPADRRTRVSAAHLHLQALVSFNMIRGGKPGEAAAQ